MYTLDIGRMRQGGVGQETLVAPGDILLFQKGAPQVLVLGQVAQPGSYGVHSKTRLLDIASAGGTEIEPERPLCA